MKIRMRVIWASGMSAILLLAGSFAGGQQKTVPTTLRQSSANTTPNDTVVQGTVISYTENSTTPPLGAHVVMQTSTGTVDVHLGNAALLKQSNISLKSGDSIRIAGRNVPSAQSTIFAARLLQKGSQSVVLRSLTGIPLKSAVRSAVPESQGGVR
jgi:hypothetical protein